MSDFEARITAKLDTSKFEQQMNKLQNKKFNVNVDTTNALQRLTALRRELDEIINAANNIRVNLSNGNNTNNAFTNVVNQGKLLLQHQGCRLFQEMACSNKIRSSS